jgi:phosphatidylinositol 4-kinase type 2
MAKGRPPTSGYARLTQTEDDEDEHFAVEERDDPHRGLPSTAAAGDREYAPVQPGRRTNRMQANISETSPRHRRQRSNSVVDLKSLNQRLERWAEEIATKLKLKKGSGKLVDTDQLEIQHSVFQAPENIRPATKESLTFEHADPPGTRMTKEQFDAIIESVRIAIENDVHPKLIAQGSSGSYFATNSAGEVVGVFKPKDEEPYASRNPKWTKWIHRNLFPFFFGRACLIPNLSYISEAAAYVLDTQLRCNLVPYTDVVSFSSKSFFYDFWDRRAFYRKKKPLPEKPGSFQVFLKGYKDATRFFKEHPWPDQASNTLEEAPRRKKKRRRWTDDCSRAEYSDDEHETEPLTSEESDRRRVFWTEGLQRKFRGQLERLVILDYIMRNTDRGSDNWMIRIDQDTQEADIVVEPPKGANGFAKLAEEPYKRPMEHMIAESRSGTPSHHQEEKATVSIGAIDNSLSWPWKHPDAWRSYPFGWLFLPVSLIGQPFTEETRRHFLPLLTSKAWWAETQMELRKCFKRDADFKERMFAKQMAIMKGQAWNVVETLKSPDHGPLELTRRARVHVWDDLVEVPVAVPLRTQSSEIRRKNTAAVEDTEEMDLSVASLPAPLPKLHELLSNETPDNERDNPFNLSRQSSQQDVREAQTTNGGTLSPPNVRFMSSSDLKGESSRDLRPNHKSRMSLDERRWQKDRPSRRHPRRLSHSAGLYGSWVDEDEADLGYAATVDRESNRKMVIVERLETVKSKNPVFTWC